MSHNKGLRGQILSHSLAFHIKISLLNHIHTYTHMFGLGNPILPFWTELTNVYPLDSYTTTSYNLLFGIQTWIHPANLKEETLQILHIDSGTNFGVSEQSSHKLSRSDQFTPFYIWIQICLYQLFNVTVIFFLIVT
jgi:hypothetical protein